MEKQSTHTNRYLTRNNFVIAIIVLSRRRSLCRTNGITMPMRNGFIGAGTKIAVNSITHETLSYEPVSRWSSEMNGMRYILRDQAMVEATEVKGMRAPQLAIGGNNQFEAMREQGFLYDNSMSANPGQNGSRFWPQTLDYKLAWQCEIGPCPNRPFPGLWEVPINQFYGYFIDDIKEFKRGAMVRAVMKPDDNKNSVKNVLIENFNRAYTTSKAPYVVTLNADFLTVLDENQTVDALKDFLTEILQKPDVYVVTMSQALDWIRDPTPLNRIDRFAPWQCPQRSRGVLAPCEFPKTCKYDTQLQSGEHSFTTCGQCPPVFPWLNNPEGKFS